MSRSSRAQGFALASLAAAAAGTVALTLLATKTVTGEATNPPFFVLLASAPLALATALAALATDAASRLTRASLVVSAALVLVVVVTIQGIK